MVSAKESEGGSRVKTDELKLVWSREASMEEEYYSECRDLFYSESAIFGERIRQLEDYFITELDATTINRRKIRIFPENSLVKLINSYISDEVSQLSRGLEYITDLAGEVGRLKNHLLSESVFPYMAYEKLRLINESISEYLAGGNCLPVLDVAYDSSSGLYLCSVNLTRQPEEKLVGLSA